MAVSMLGWYERDHSEVKITIAPIMNSLSNHGSYNILHRTVGMYPPPPPSVEAGWSRYHIYFPSTK